MKLWSFDVESWGEFPEYGLQPWRASKGRAGITCFATGWANGSGKTETKCTWLRNASAIGLTPLTAFLATAHREGAYIACWNGVFDIAWVLAYAQLADRYAEGDHACEGLSQTEKRDLIFKVKWLDGMLLYRRIINSPDKKLVLKLKAVVASRYPKYAGYEEGVNFNPITQDEKKRLQIYNRLDAWFTRELTLTFWKMLTPNEQKNALIEAECLPLAAEANLHGLHVHGGNLQALDDQLTRTIDGAYAELSAAEPDIALVNLNSPDQVACLLFKKWGLKPIKNTLVSGKSSTDKETLHELAQTYPLAKVLRTYREGVNTRTKFSTAIVKALEYNEDGRVRPQFRPFAAYTGRGTYSSHQRKGKSRGKNDYPIGFALHQMKRESAFRKAIAPPPGYTLVEADFDGQEYRWMAVLSKDANMLALCAPGEDAHAYMGGEIAAMPYAKLRALLAAEDARAKQIRFLGKVGNLSCQYRISAKRLRATARVQYDLAMDEETSIRVHDIYRTTYPGVPDYWKKQIAGCRDKGEVWTLAGRKVRLEGDWGWEQESTAINFPIQGIGADQKYLALAVARGYLPRVEGRFYYELHDGVYFLIPTKHVVRAAPELKILLSNLPYKRAWNVDLPIQFPVTVKTGPTWGEMKEWAQ